jgi:hypothetical protein
MGSTGSGNFSDYSGSSPSGGGNSGGSSGEDRCLRALTASLEDVERCSYFEMHNNVPDVGTEVSISFNQRLIAISNAGLTIGILPTKFNYLKVCMDAGITYSGRVSKSSNDLISVVSIDVIPEN